MNGIKFSKKEITHLVISVLVMGILVAVNMGADQKNSAGTSAILDFAIMTLNILPLSLAIIVPAFVFHELGHKVMAQRFGFWAEYRMWTQGLLIAVLIAVLSKGNFLFIAPGAVYFAASSMRHASAEKVGKIGLIGPVINIMLSTFFGALAMLTGGIVATISAVGATVNAFLAIFNLIPIQPLDGQKVFAWDKKIWFAAIALAISLFLFVGIFRSGM